MQQAIVLDVETTGLIEPQVIQLAQTTPFEYNGHDSAAVTVTRFKPTKPIEPGAMAVHRIIAEDLADAPEWPGWEQPKQVEYLIGHMIDSDWAAIGKPDIRLIDTCVMAKRKWDALGSYKLTALIFALYKAAEARDMTENAHDAETDVNLTVVVLDHLIFDLPEIRTFEQLWQYSEEARIPLRIGFSKYGPKNGQPGTLYTDVPTGMLRWIIDPLRVNDMDQYEVIATKRELTRRGLL